MVTVAQQCVLVDATELYVYLKMIKMVNFVLHIFHYNLKKMKEIIAMGNFFSDRLKKKNLSRVHPRFWQQWWDGSVMAVGSGPLWAQASRGPSNCMTFCPVLELTQDIRETFLG